MTRLQGERTFSGAAKPYTTCHHRRVFRVPSDLGRRLDAIHEPIDDPHPLAFAAVVGLLADVNGPDPKLLLIERAGTLRHHAGQLAFPGGKPEPGDRDLVATALREAHEEVGVPNDAVSILGRLSPVPTPTGYLIVPFVGRLEVEVELVSSDEVRRMFWTPLARLADPSLRTKKGERTWRGLHYELHEYAIGDPPLWGATARMVSDLLDRIRGPLAPDGTPAGSASP